MVWQEFPLSSSGIDNWPPEDDKSIAALTAIARSYIERRQHHPSLIVWCGGNELQGNLAGGKTGGGKPCDLEHPLLCALDNVVSEMDPVSYTHLLGSDYHFKSRPVFIFQAIPQDIRPAIDYFHIGGIIQSPDVLARVVEHSYACLLYTSPPSAGSRQS